MLVKASEGSEVHVLYMKLDGASPLPWIAALVLIGIGVFATMKMWPRVSDAWGTVLALAHGRDEP
jgi:hypothetical protein